MSFAIQSADRTGQSELLLRMFDARIAYEPQNAQHRASKAFVQYQNGDVDGSIETLQIAVDEISSFAESGNCYIGNLQSGADPAEGC